MDPKALFLPIIPATPKPTLKLAPYHRASLYVRPPLEPLTFEHLEPRTNLFVETPNLTDEDFDSILFSK